MKDDLRLRFRAKRDALGPHQRDTAAARIGTYLEALDEYRKARTVLFYASFGSEVATSAMMDRARAQGKDVVLPRMEGKDLQLHAWPGEPPLVVHRYGVPEPDVGLPTVQADQIEVAVVPGLAFDHRGTRLGYGGGYYDRFLRTARHAFRVGLSFAPLRVPTLPTARWDVSVDVVITEDGVHVSNAQ